MKNSKNNQSPDFSENLNTNRESINEAIKKGDKNALVNTLSKEDREKLNSILNDKKAISDILKSPEAKAIIKNFFGGKNG